MSAEPADGVDPTEPSRVEPDLIGPDLARAALARARARAADKGLRPTVRRRSRPAETRRSDDARDPMLFGDAVRRLIAEQGWTETASAARVLGEWDRLVGPEIADHCRPTSLVDNELVLVAESTAWATQLRLMTGPLLRRLTEGVGEGVVTRLVVRGPAQPDWRRGPRRVLGRGPRDTYG